jgi:hypothetical protein
MESALSEGMRLRWIRPRPPPGNPMQQAVSGISDPALVTCFKEPQTVGGVQGVMGKVK